MTHHSFATTIGFVAGAARARLRHRIRELLDLDGLEQYMADADLRWHAMLDELGYPPLRDAEDADQRLPERARQRPARRLAPPVPVVSSVGVRSPR